MPTQWRILGEVNPLRYIAFGNVTPMRCSHFYLEFSQALFSIGVQSERTLMTGLLT